MWGLEQLLTFAVAIFTKYKPFNYNNKQHMEAVWNRGTLDVLCADAY